jgi:hypothetical protein
MINLTEQDFSSGKPIAQGEVLFWMNKYAPKELLDGISGLKMSNVTYDDNTIICGHSETGHHHVIQPVENKSITGIITAVVDFDDKYMMVCANDSFMLIHCRNIDTHDGFIFPPGDYIRVLREEQTIDGWRRVID